MNSQEYTYKQREDLREYAKGIPNATELNSFFKGDNRAFVKQIREELFEAIREEEKNFEMDYMVRVKKIGQRYTEDMWNSEWQKILATVKDKYMSRRYEVTRITGSPERPIFLGDVKPST